MCTACIPIVMRLIWRLAIRADCVGHLLALGAPGVSGVM